MAFYVVRDQTNGTYLSMLGDRWVTDLREAAVFARRSTALHTIRPAYGATGVSLSVSNGCPIASHRLEDQDLGATILRRTEEDDRAG